MAMPHLIPNIGTSNLVFKLIDCVGYNDITSKPTACVHTHTDGLVNSEYTNHNEIAYYYWY